MLVGDDPASHIYIEMKHKAATAAGFESRDVRLPESATQAEVMSALAESYCRVRAALERQHEFVARARARCQPGVS